MDETRERFLNHIVAKLSAERIVEVHLFSPLRQGVIETGVAVIAAPPLAAVPVAEGSGEDDNARHVVFTARYRFTRKGPERGKWLFELAAQADAPLAMVDTVVRGVRDRAKDLTETDRLSGDELRALMAAPSWRTTL